MRRIFVLSFLLASLVLVAQEEKPIVLVELFTSEGCSSCPPADRLLSNVINSSSEEVEVLGLSFHVDYWDYIGWKDPYANADHTQRQRAYGRKFRLNSIYTPQMIVNGKHEFVGSNRQELGRALRVESLIPYNLFLNVSIDTKTAEKIIFKVSSEEAVDLLLNVTIVEKKLSQDVKRGENRGRTLSHDNVVRAFDSRSFNGQENIFALGIPEDLKGDDASLIVYAQTSSNWHIVGAERISFNEIE
ncbi:MAG: DUF1223 domain-containing protein [Ekhidna sp.]|nr:DUF1223 domain-containing protein [Ekhidna sp.]